MRIMRFTFTAGFVVCIALALHAQQTPSQPAAGARAPGSGRGGGAAPGQLIGGTLTPAKPDARATAWVRVTEPNPRIDWVLPRAGQP